MTDWSRLRDAYDNPAHDIPALFAGLGPNNREQTWRELHARLCDHESAYPVSFATLPLLWEVATTGTVEDRHAALSLAGDIVLGAAREGEGPAVLAPHTRRIADMAALADEHLREHPRDTYYIHMLQATLALSGHPLWGFAITDDLTDAFFDTTCPACAADVIIAIGDHGNHSAIRDWDLGDIDRRPLTPTPPERLLQPGRFLLKIAIRDRHASLTQGLPYLFGHAQCPPCGAVFAVAPAHEEHLIRRHNGRSRGESLKQQPPREMITAVTGNRRQVRRRSAGHTHS